MTAGFELVERPSRDEWMEVARADPRATFFHTPDWIDVAARQVPAWEDASVFARHRDGTLAIYPLVRRRRRLLAARAPAVSSFARTYGGPISARPLTTEEEAALHEELLRRRPGRVDVTLPPGASADAVPASFGRERDVTHVVVLDGEFETLLRRFSRGHRAAYNRVQRAGVQTTAATGAAAIDEYLAMYAASRARWAERTLSRYPRAVFERLDELARAGQGVRLTFALLDGRPLAGVWTLHWNHHVAVWHVASHDAPPRLSPTMAIYGSLMRASREEGASVLDLNPSGGQANVAESKRRYGAQERPVWRLSARRPVASAVDGLLGRATRLRRSLG